ncbi:MAG: alpha-amylase family glycosyl hydrolase [Bacteroidota bacterium]|nr:alpha-amylase family glycosyl hydrolase [Bacteroidota bacterium]
MSPFKVISILIMTTLGTIKSFSQYDTLNPASREKLFDTLYSSKELGCTVKKEGTTFRLFAPRASQVWLVLFENYDDEKGEEIKMVRDDNGVWEYMSLGRLYGKCYGYRLEGPAGIGEYFDSTVIIGDPYSKAVVTKNNYHHPAKTLILDTKYNWDKDTFIIPANHNELIIYECHVRDLTAHPSSEVDARGTYIGLTEKGKTGGLSYLKKLGVNAVEFLPLHKFGNIEIPYNDSSVVSDEGKINTWNPYARNHWGYMTSYFFAPETYYASDGTMMPDEYNGIGGRAVKELKDLVKALHREGIAVIMDVVYNHVSQYDYNPFKYIDKFYYFHTDSAGNFMKASGCGNDFYTSRLMARRLIVESIKYWMKEYHIDGFRFDLAAMIDDETLNEITREAKKINPNVILIAEPWGGGKYDPQGFSDIGWVSWNDKFRNGVKGQNPYNDAGFIFGRFQDKITKKSVMSFITGTLREDGGIYLKKEHSMNYLESHDDHTMGDFIRIATGAVTESTQVIDKEKHITLTPIQLAINKLAAMFLLTAQGPVMIHEGQEFARSKVIAPTRAPDPRIGMIDRNSYEKDNETNYLNYMHRELNRELFDYYIGLIEVRNQYPIFSSAPKEAVEFLKTDDDFVVAFKLDAKKAKSISAKNSFIVILNGNPTKGVEVILPKGIWKIIADDKKVTSKKQIIVISKTAPLPPTSGMILMSLD